MEMKTNGVAVKVVCSRRKVEEVKATVPARYKESRKGGSGSKTEAKGGESAGSKLAALQSDTSVGAFGELFTRV